MKTNKYQQKLQYNKHADSKELPQLYPRQDVAVLDKATKTWKQATVVSKCPEPRSYIVQTNSGRVRRTRAHLRERAIENEADHDYQPETNQAGEMTPSRAQVQHANTETSKVDQQQEQVISTQDSHSSPAKNGQTTSWAGRIIRNTALHRVNQVFTYKEQLQEGRIIPRKRSTGCLVVYPDSL